MSQNYIIREATDADYPQILSIYRYYWDEHFKNMSDDYEKVLSYLKEAFDKRETYFNYWIIGNNNDEILGWASCIPMFLTPLRKGYNGELSIYLRFDKINKTLGFKLLNEVVKILEKSPLYMLYGHICPNNTISQKMALKVGLKNTEIQFINSPFYPEINLWIKPLKGVIEKN